jgi:hypothetical protein
MSLIGKNITVKNADFTDVAISGVEKYTLNSITVTTNPTKQVYEVGETFNPAGMIVTATLVGNVSGDIITKNITDYTYSPTSAFAETGTTTITISYTLDDVTRTTTLTVQVNPVTVKYNFTASCTNGTISPTSGQVSEGGSQTFVVTHSQNYKMPTQVTCTGGTASISGNQITVSSVIGDVTLSVECVALIIYNITGSITNGSLTGATTILEGSGATVTVNPTSGYGYPTEVNVIGATASYLATSGVVTLNNPTSDVVITATCPEQPVGTGNWFSNILASDDTAHEAWISLNTADITNPTSLKYQTAGASAMQGKTISKIALQNPTTTGIYLDFYTADDISNKKVTNLSAKLETINLQSDGNVQEYTLSNPITVPNGKTIVIYVSSRFKAKVAATWANLGSIYYSFGSEPSEGQTLSNSLGWSAFDFYLESEGE